MLNAKSTTVSNALMKLSAEEKRIFSAGYCTADALYNILGGSFEESVKCIASAVLKRSGKSPILADVLKAIETHPDILGTSRVDVRNAREARQQCFEALEQVNSGAIYLLVFQNSFAGSHIESIYRGQISNPVRVSAANHPSAAEGAREASLESRRQFLEQMFKRERASNFSLVIMQSRTSINLAQEKL